MEDLKIRPATREEILDYYRHNTRVSFQTYVREIYSPKSKNGVRHIQRASSKIRNADGVPMVRRHNQDFELFANFYTLPSGKTFVSCPTIIKPREV